ncbi:MAG: cyd operon YbgE family protein [Xanthobacteraceae bacterium]|nr:cyd operon YbgE family protein [Xanthobacteraceae bacterium]
MQRAREQTGAWSQAMRYVSFAIGLVASVMLMLFPFLLHQVSSSRLHTGLPILMLGVAGTFVHGVGYVPDNKFLRILFGPFCSWTLILIGGLLLSVRN